MALVALIGLCAAAGLAPPLWVKGMLSFYLGYGAVFGFSNGVGYALAIQLAARLIHCAVQNYLAALHKNHYINGRLMGRLDSLGNAEARTARIGDLP